MLSHENAVSFVDWCSEVFEPHADDRFSSHAPFHFDLSILDIYVCLKHGATLVLIGEDIGKDPRAPRRADRATSESRSGTRRRRSSSLLAQFGKLRPARLLSAAPRAVRRRGVPGQAPPRACRAVAGRRATSISTARPKPTSARSTRSPADRRRTARCRSRSARSARICGARSWIRHGRRRARGDEGELCIAGRGVMQGYWALPEQTERAFLADDDGARWYRTGDIVIEAPDGNYTYLGRRDRMVKRRGYRVELGEIEAGLYQHPLDQGSGGRRAARRGSGRQGQRVPELPRGRSARRSSR